MKAKEYRNETYTTHTFPPKIILKLIAEENSNEKRHTARSKQN
jgi:hypothetical protein